MLFPPRQITRNPPRTVEAEIDPQYGQRLVADQRGRYLVPIGGARLVGRSGLVVLPDGSFAVESVYDRALLEADPDYRRLSRRPCVEKPGNHFSLIVTWSRDGNYYHWFHDTLTRLYGAVEWLPPDTRYIVPADLAPFQRDSLRLLGIEDHQLAPFTGEEVWELETLHFAPPTTNSGSDRRDADLWVRDRIMRACGITPARDGHRIYISRRNAPGRRLVNEEAVERLLHGHGFETCVAETLSLTEQIALFARAEAVVAPHGAGFTNMLFSAPGLVVVDMIEASRLSHAYVFWTMAEELGHEYWYLLAESVPGPGQQRDASVPLEKLATILDRLELD